MAENIDLVCPKCGSAKEFKLYIHCVYDESCTVKSHEKGGQSLSCDAIEEARMMLWSPRDKCKCTCCYYAGDLKEFERTPFVLHECDYELMPVYDKIIGHKPGPVIALNVKEVVDRLSDDLKDRVKLGYPVHLCTQEIVNAIDDDYGLATMIVKEILENHKVSELKRKYWVAEWNNSGLAGIDNKVEAFYHVTVADILEYVNSDRTIGCTHYDETNWVIGMLKCTNWSLVPSSVVDEKKKRVWIKPDNKE